MLLTRKIYMLSSLNSFFKAGAQSRSVLIAVNSNKPTTTTPYHNTRLSSVGNSSEFVSLLVNVSVCECAGLFSVQWHQRLVM